MPWHVGPVSLLVKNMRAMAQELDAEGKEIRQKDPNNYKIPEFFRAADALRNAADSLEYASA